jgi:hypothetical protein
VQGGVELRVLRQAGIVDRLIEAAHEALAEIAHVAVVGVHVQDGGLVATRLRKQRRATQHLGPIGSEPLDVLRVLTGMRERMVQLRIIHTARVMRCREREKRGLPARELE